MLLDKADNKYCTEERLIDLWNLFIDKVWSTNSTGDLTLAKWASQQSPGANVINTFKLIITNY